MNRREDVQERKEKDRAPEENQREVDDRYWGDKEETGGKGPGRVVEKNGRRRGGRGGE